MKKKLSFILALAIAATMLAGCKKTNEDSNGMPDAETSSISLTQMTTEATTTTVAETTTTEEETTTVSEETTVSETEETTTVPSDTTTAAETTTTAATTAKRAWSETEISETHYIKTACYSRKEAIVGSESVKKYEAGTKINIVAATDTGYYKLADGTFIHSDYVTDEKPSSEETTATTKKDDDTPTPDKDTTGGHKVTSSTYKKSYKDKYAYKQLSKDEQTLYANIVNAAENFERRVSVPDGMLSEDIFKVYLCVFNQEPQLFWLSTSVPFGLGDSIELEYTLSAEQAAEVQAEIDANVKEIMKSVNGYSSTVSRLKVIYDWIILNNTFSKNGTFETCSVYNGLTGGELQCQGYAKSVLYLCDVAGIECMTVIGENYEGHSHAWNVVYCVDGYYIFDTTWGDPVVAYGGSDYIKYQYFLVSDEMTKDTHLKANIATRANGNEVKLFTPPACTKTSCNYFKAYKKEFDNLDDAVKGMYAELDAAIASGKNVAHIRVTDKELWETLTSNDYFRKFQDYAKSKSSKVSALNRCKTRTEGTLMVEYDVKY